MKPIYLFRLLFAITILLNTLGALGQELYTGVWRQGNDAHAMLPGYEWAEFNNKWAANSAQNLRLTDVETYTKNGKRYFISLWRQGNDAHALLPPMDWAQFSSEWSRVSKEGLRLTDIETYTDAGKRYFLSVWRQGNDAHAMLPPMEWAQFNSEWLRVSKDGLRLTDIETYTENGKRYYLSVYRAGNDAHALIPPMEWAQFESEWQRVSKEGLRLIDFETYKENGKQYYIGVYRQGNDGHYLWNGADWEELNAVWAKNEKSNLRITDLETYESDCNENALNTMLQPYAYGITASELHCEGQPGTCPTASANGKVWYNWPAEMIDNTNYIRMSAVSIKDAIFTLPFNEKPENMNGVSGWLYEPGSWHEAIDYSKKGGTILSTFKVMAAAPGKVIHIGWDDWSGNTIVISHDARGKKDVYRTIYMHLRNGGANDCNNAWAKSLPALSDTSQAYRDYKTHLQKTGCPVNTASRNPDINWWGNDAYKIDMNLLGKTVNAGDHFAWAGSTGPGGSAANHLHIFFAHKDATDNKWYLFDPYGIYSYGSFYPSPINGPINYNCARYPVAWKNGKPTFPN
jgi:Peptidase family M23/Bacterial tandem repeat domain 1